MSWRSPALLLMSGLASLGSLFLPWQKASCGQDCPRGDGGVENLLQLFGALEIDGWSAGVGYPGVGDAVALSALTLAVLSAVVLARPDRAGRLPLVGCALSVAVFALANAAETRTAAEFAEISTGIPYDAAYGTYFGLAMPIIGVAVAGAMRRGSIASIRSIRSALSLAQGSIAACVIAALVFLPWVRSDFVGEEVGLHGIMFPGGLLATALAIVLLRPSLSGRQVAPWLCPVLACSCLLFTGAAFASASVGQSSSYGAWFALGSAVALAFVTLVAHGGLPRFRPSGVVASATTAAAAVFVVGLFLPWQRWDREDVDVGWTNGWDTTNAAAALVAIGLVTLTHLRRRSPSRLGLGTAIGLLVATSGFSLESRTDEFGRLSWGYGAKTALVAAGLLVTLAFVGIGRRAISWSRALVRLAPIAGCVVYVCLVVLPWWGVLPDAFHVHLSFAPVSWLAIAGLLLAIWLAELWVRQILDAASGPRLLAVVPLVLLAFTLLNVLRLGSEHFTWGTGMVLTACALLALLGWIEEHEGLESFRIPEALRLDRL